MILILPPGRDDEHADHGHQGPDHPEQKTTGQGRPFSKQCERYQEIDAEKQEKPENPAPKWCFHRLTSSWTEKIGLARSKKSLINYGVVLHKSILLSNGCLPSSAAEGFFYFQIFK